MKENLISDKSLIYQWNFNDNSSVVDNPRVKATVNGNPTFKDGVAIFNGSTDYYKLKTLINLGTKYSIEIKFKLSYIPVGSVLILGKDSTNRLLYINSANIIYHNIGAGNSYISWTRDTNWHTYTISRNGTSILHYLDGMLISSTNSGIITGGFIFNTVASDETGGIKFNGQLEYIKIWNRQLTASEVKNNYNSKTYRGLPYKSTTLFHINSDNGVIRDLTGKTVPVATNVALPKIGSNIDVMKFNGSSGNINLGTQALLGDITFIGWCNPTTFGEGNEGYMISNTKFQLLIYIINKAIQISRNGFSNAAIVNNLIKLSNVLFICVISTSTGITNFYIGDKNNPPVLSGTANQSAGTPVAGTTCYLGNRAADDRTLNGWLNDVRLEQSILTLEEITQAWSNTKIKYQ